MMDVVYRRYYILGYEVRHTQMKGATSKAYTTQFRQQQEGQQGAKLEKYGPGRV